MRDSSPPPVWPERDADHVLVTAAQMAALEASLFASGLPVEALMEKAGLAMAHRLLTLADGAAAGLARPAEALRRHGALVLAGPGHNGGDGLVVVRELHLAGVPVRFWCPFERAKPLTEAHRHHARWLGITQLAEAPDPQEPCLWIDALFGLGQTRAPGPSLEDLLARRRGQAGGLVALDVPTGLCSDTGERLGTAAAAADLTLCLGLIKQGLVQDAALAWVGQLERIELGLPAALLEALPVDQPLGLGGPGPGANDGAQAPRPRPAPDATKYGRGRLLVIAGSERYPGAAHLALLGASAAGCGSLRAGIPRPMAASLWTVLPHVVPEADPFNATALERLDAVLVGPGLGLAADDPWHPGVADATATEAFWEPLRAFSGPLVIDADGLNRISAAWLGRRAGPSWITPHAAEFSRLFPALADLPPLEAAAAAARSSGATVLLKGARTVVASPDGRRWQVLQSSPDAARGGLGDVLAGYAAGLAARAAACGSLEPSVLALAALDHALAGCRAAARRGPGGALPQAVARQLERAAQGPETGALLPGMQQMRTQKPAG